jgi:RNA polymerase-binding transcription factor DksA
MAESLESTVRASLEQEKAQLGQAIEDLGDAGHDENFADSGQVAAEQGEAQALAASLREQLDAVEAALTKLDEGTYGQCEVCGNAIPDARLEAMPASRFCIDHA